SFRPSLKRPGPASVDTTAPAGPGQITPSSACPPEAAIRVTPQVGGAGSGVAGGGQAPGARIRGAGQAARSAEPERGPGAGSAGSGVGAAEPGEPVRVDVAAGEDHSGPLRERPGPAGEQGGQPGRAARFQDGLQPLEGEAHRLTDLVVADQHDAVEQSAVDG